MTGHGRTPRRMSTLIMKMPNGLPSWRRSASAMRKCRPVDLLDQSVAATEIERRDVDLSGTEPDRFLEVVAIASLLQFLFGDDPNRVVRSRAVDADQLAAVVVEADDPKHRIAGLGFEFGQQARRDPVAPGLFGDAVDRIDAARLAGADQSVQRHRRTKARNVAGRAGRVVFEIGRDLPRMRLDAVAGALQQRLFQVAIAQPSDRGNRDRDQRNHRDGKPGCERHVGGRSPSRSGPASRRAESDAMAHYGEEATPPAGRGRAAPGGFQAARDGCQQVRRPERLLQAGDRAELGRHGQEVRGGVRLRRDRPAGDDDDRNLRPVLANHPHGFEPIHSRHEDVEEQQIEISGLAQCQALSAVVGSDHAMAGAFEQQADGHLDRRIVIHDQYSCQSKKFSGLCWNQINGRLRVLPNPPVAATASPAGTFRSGRQKAGIKTQLSACCRADKYEALAPARMICPREPAHAASAARISRISC